MYPAKPALFATTMFAGLVGLTHAWAATIDGPIATAAVQTSAPSTQSEQGILATQPQAQRDRADVTNTTQREEVVVTGTRIARPNLDQPTPISTLSPKQIQNSGTTNLGDIISQLPAVGFSGTLRANSNSFGNQSGLSQINLRDLGTSRTLVLVDGQRHVAGDILTNAVDVNSIPTALVDHVEVVTGGASAIYGSDAVTGVVNIITKKKFEGVEIQAQTGSYDNGFGDNYNAYATVGHDFLDGKLNVTATGYWSKQAGIDAHNLPQAHNYGSIVNSADIDPKRFDPTYFTSGSPITKDGIVNRFQVQDVGTDFLSRNGVLLSGTTFLPFIAFTKGGTPVNPTPRTGYNSASFGQLPNCGDTCYYLEDNEQLQTPLETYGADFTAHYDFSSHLHASLDAKYAQTNSDNVVQPSYTFGDFQLQPDNAFITPALQQRLTGLDPADYPYYAGFLNGGRGNYAKRQTYRIVAGLSGDFDARIAQVNWDGAINYGETDSRFLSTGLRLSPAADLTQGNFAAAFDSVIDPATGAAACRINVPSAQGPGYTAPTGVLNPGGCVPFNPFGQQASPAAFGYSFINSVSRDKLSQQVANLNASFDTSRFFKLQGGPLAVAFGGEYRMERTREINDAFVVAGNTENLAANSAGGFNVYEGYVEGNLPIFKRFAPGLDELSLDAAYRASHYSTVGNTTAYKFSGVYGPVRDLKIRGTYSRAVRAPNITEAFAPVSSGFFNITDPCDVSNITANVNYAKNCLAAGVPANFTSTTNSSIIGTSGGNPDLKPEKSISYTGGVVLQPRWIPRLSVTLDYYSIKIKDAILQVAAQDVINNCFNGDVLDPQYCSQFTRGPDNNINSVNTTYLNAAKLQTDGIDLQANYTVGVAGLTEKLPATRFIDGRLTFDLTANYLLHLRNFPFQNIPNQVNVVEGSVRTFSGQNVVDSPHLKGTLGLTYQQGGLQIFYQTRYLGRAANCNRDATAVDKSEPSDQPFAKSVFFHDIVARYDLGGRLKGTQVFLGVNDIFGDTPPGYLIGTGGDVGYDLGRYIFGGIKVRL